MFHVNHTEYNNKKEQEETSKIIVIPSCRYHAQIWICNTAYLSWIGEKMRTHHTGCMTYASIYRTGWKKDNIITNHKKDIQKIHHEVIHPSISPLHCYCICTILQHSCRLCSSKCAFGKWIHELQPRLPWVEMQVWWKQIRFRISRSNRQGCRWMSSCHQVCKQWYHCKPSGLWRLLGFQIDDDSVSLHFIYYVVKLSTAHANEKDVHIQYLIWPAII